MKDDKALERYKDRLAIDADALSECLVEQPDLYYHVTMEHVRAKAEVDATKLSLDELTATVDQQVRQKAAAAEEKVTEAVVQQRVRLDDEIMQTTRMYLDDRAKAEQWQALRDAFQQRSFMLRELVALRISERSDLAAAAGAGQRPSDAGTRMADETVRAGSEARSGYRVRRRRAAEDA